MAGELTPLVLIPRYSTYAGPTSFTTIGMDVTEYSKAYVNVWRAQLGGTGPTFSISFEESTDQQAWTVCAGGTGGDPGTTTETQYTPDLKKRWFRALIVLGGGQPVATCWAIGFLEARQS